MLASLVVAWSSQLQFSAKDSRKACDCYCLLAVGTKSGSISIWRFDRPSYYSVEHADDSINKNFIGVIQAHDSWVTALSWGFLVTAGDNVLVSVVSLCVPIQSPRKVQLAFGKGSGSFEVWMCDTEVKSSHNVGSYDAHVQAITGLVWAFDGRCLYSCSQDNSMRGWIYHKSSLSEASVPPNNLGTRSFSDLPSVSDSCYGMAISPGNLALAVARRFDAGQLDHMYQKRTQRAAVEFFWIGGQQVDLPLIANLELDVEGHTSFSKEELGYWGSKLLLSLKQYECHNKHLVIWDIIAALSAFKPYAPWFVKHIVLRWLELLLKDYVDPSIRNILSNMPKYMSNISSRHLHLLNIFCRRVIASSGFEADKVYTKPAALIKPYGEEEQQWMDILLNSEKELRERMVGFSLSTVSICESNQASKANFGLWNPIGVAQMVKWVIKNKDCVNCQLTLLASELEGLGARLQSVCDYSAEEQCSFCSAAIPFESPEIAYCKGIKCPGQEAAQQHKLSRCAVSMKVCPVTAIWFCMCCRRRASNLPPLQLFTMNNYPPDFLSFTKSSMTNLIPIPLCPFCGISLQRLQPDFLLSISPV
ncbi:Notchless protein-like protein 1 [Bienertia sinuspersici]